MATPEKLIVTKITKMLKALQAEGWPLWYLKIHGGPMQTAGVPDLIIICYGRVLMAEIKIPGGKPTHLQTYTMSRLREAGATTGVFHSAEEVRAVLKQWRKIAVKEPAPCLS